MNPLICPIYGIPYVKYIIAPAVAIVGMLSTLRRDYNITKVETDAWVSEYVRLTGNEHVLSLYNRD